MSEAIVDRLEVIEVAQDPQIDRAEDTFSQDFFTVEEARKHLGRLSKRSGAIVANCPVTGDAA